jgi:hypothetical protein
VMQRPSETSAVYVPEVVGAYSDADIDSKFDKLLAIFVNKECVLTLYISCEPPTNALVYAGNCLERPWDQAEANNRNSPAE